MLGLGSRPRALALSGALAAALLSAPAALAQPGPPGSPDVSSVTVTAPRLLRGDTGSLGLRGGPIKVVSQSRAVSFADLDLTREGGVIEFRRRILYGVLAACDDLEAKYPSNIYVPMPNQDCPDTTARGAMAVADEVIAAARSHGR